MPRRLTTFRDPDASDFRDGWARQRRTAAEILRRFDRQEGVVLADQVGMGKTFVALAVAASEVMSLGGEGQVVIHVPPPVGDKWVNEWKTFQDLYLPPDSGIRAVDAAVRSGTELLRLLDDPPDRRRHILVVTHNALSSRLKDAFVQLAIVWMALHHARGGDQLRSRVAKWSGGNAGLFGDSRLTSALVDRLLRTRPETWLATCRSAGLMLDDDPVPQHLVDARGALDLTEIRRALADLPQNRSAHLAERLKSARKELTTASDAVFRQALSAARLSLPLLIVDEAHRMKNDATRLARLFAADSPDGPGALHNAFDRMLFLTATPFELGHRELIAVLGRLSAVRAATPFEHPPAEPLPTRLERLGQALDEAQRSANALDQAWARMTSDEVRTFADWSPTRPAPQDSPVSVRRAWEQAREAVARREDMHTALAPWLIRNERPARRRYRPGSAINGGDGVHGLAIGADLLFPFLMAGRAQLVAAADPDHSGQYFAYGLASSFAAFLKADLTADRDTDDEPTAEPTGAPVSPMLQWYSDRVSSSLHRLHAEDRRHPKVDATVNKAADLWQGGDKCLVFCWFIRTGAAVQEALDAEIGKRVLLLARRHVSMVGTSDEDVRASLERVSSRLFDADRPSYAEISGRLRQLLEHRATRAVEPVSAAELDRLVDVVIRHLRRSEYLVRFTTFRDDLDVRELWDGLGGDNPTEVDFLGRVADYTERWARKSATARERILDALAGSQDEGDPTTRRGGALGSVRRASGATKRDVRQRLTDQFNTPFAPDLLVASSVMGEGIDLHEECKNVIHHDLDWNPSTLEQRTGRLDRLGSLVEREATLLQVYEPYLAGTHDEKMFKVVKDRAGWFGIVMGRPTGRSESETDAEESRPGLAPIISQHLRMTFATAAD